MRGNHESQTAAVKDPPPRAYLAAGVSIIGAIVTRAATVPLMTRVMSATNDAVFTSLNGWWMLNDALHTAAFVCNLSVLAMLSISVSKTDA